MQARVLVLALAVVLAPLAFTDLVPTASAADCATLDVNGHPVDPCGLLCEVFEDLIVCSLA
jgi:hypothetical protein